MELLTQIFMVLMIIFMIVLIFSAIILGLVVLDYLLDANLKEDLNRVLGKRTRLKRVRQKVLDIFKKNGQKGPIPVQENESAIIRDDAWYDFKLLIGNKKEKEK